MWQDISTAPRNGRFILLKGGKTTEGDDIIGVYPELAEWDRRPVIAMFHPQIFNQETEEFGAWAICFWDGAWRTTYNDPTHWMDVPENGG